MIVERAKALRYLMESLAETLDDEKALEVTELFPNWKVNKEYEMGVRVRYDNVLYKCLITHISQSDWIPKDSVSLWAKVLIPDPDIVPEWIQPDSTNPYMIGDKVKHNEKTWISIIDYNVYEPGIYGWNEII